MKMKCACLSSNSVSYDQLTDGISFSDLNSEDKDNTNEKLEEILFYNDDGSYQTVVVEKNLRANDLCQILALKNRVSLDINWTIVESWVDYGLERSLEDHEDVFSVNREMTKHFPGTDKRFIFRRDFRKYEFFKDPEQFFPAEMMDLPDHNEFVYATNRGSSPILHRFLANFDECPVIFSQIWIREINKHVWAKAFMLLKNGKLYASYKVQVADKLPRHWNNSVGCLLNKDAETQPQVYSGEDWGHLQLLADLSEYAVYSPLNAKNQLQAPSEYGLCLCPAGCQALDNTEGLLCLACESERVRTCWATAMRLAKYGKQLRKNYLAFRNKQDPLSSKEYNRYTVPNESVRSRVAMDFTGSVGRIVEDPKEAKAIAVAEGNSWRRRWRSNPRPSVSQTGLESGVHVTQPWFHSGMSRDQAAQLIHKFGTVDGVFLVRESRSDPGSFVLTFKCGVKVIHSHIQPVRSHNVVDPALSTVCFSLDSGMTKFYDLLQLVEFYQLNAGCLPTRLTHYLVQSSSDKPSSNSSF